LLAQILVMELSAARTQDPFDFDELRRALGLPTLDGMDPSQIDFDRLAAWHLVRLDVAKLSDEQLEDAYGIALTPRS
jgi:hypothetical protein